MNSQGNSIISPSNPVKVCCSELWSVNRTSNGPIGVPSNATVDGSSPDPVSKLSRFGAHVVVVVVAAVVVVVVLDVVVVTPAFGIK